MENKTAIKMMPDIPTIENIHDCYILYYRHGLNPKCDKGFICPGGLKTAQARAQQHCEVMGYTFIFVRPMICDIEEEEKRRLGKV